MFSSFKIELQLDCEEIRIPIVKSSACGEEAVKRAANKNPLPILIRKLRSLIQPKYWLLTDYVFSKWNEKGEDITKYEKQMDALIEEEECGVMLVKKTYIDEYAGFLLPDTTIICGLIGKPTSLNGFSAEDEWKKRNMNVYIECEDYKYIAVCMQDLNSLDLLKQNLIGEGIKI